MFPTDGMEMKFAKQSRIKNPELVREYRQTYCQYCGVMGVKLGNHHIFSRGSGGPDAKWNLITLCELKFGGQSCHDRAQQYKIPRIELLLIKARQLKAEQEEIDAMLEYCFRKLSEADYNRLERAIRGDNHEQV